MQLPAGYLSRITAAHNVYQAITSYKSAGGRTVEWTARNPQAWQLVSRLLKDRMQNGTQ